MINSIIFLICLSLGNGDYQDREYKTHMITISQIKYDKIKQAYHTISDPEIRHRLKKIAWHKWTIEMDYKYINEEWYHEHSRTNYGLEKLGFEEDFNKIE
jgi:hypothetical protein